MAVVSTPLVEEAERIFTELGYTVTTAGRELRAERKWRVVYINTDGPDRVANDGDLRCFVVREADAEALREDLLTRAPDYDWAVLGVDPAGDYRIHHPQASEGLPT